MCKNITKYERADNCLKNRELFLKMCELFAKKVGDFDLSPSSKYNLHANVFYSTSIIKFISDDNKITILIAFML